MAPPTKPSFTWEVWEGFGDKCVEVNWIPDMEGNPGSSFRVVYRKNGQSQWKETERIIDAMYTIIYDLIRDTVYDMAVVSIDGEYSTQSDVQEIKVISYVSRYGYLALGMYAWILLIPLGLALVAGIACYCLFLANNKELL